jgi:hypothetical protein
MFPPAVNTPLMPGAQAPGQPPTSGSRLKILSLRDILGDTSPPPPPIVDNGILLDKTLLLLFGPKKARKTFLALNFGLAISTGTSFACFDIAHSQKVLHLSAEGGYYPTRERIRQMSKARSIPQTDNYLVSTRTLIDLKLSGLDVLKQNLDLHRPRVLILDPLARFHSADENSAHEMSQVLGLLRGLIEQYSLSIILVHHAGKDSSRGARGSSAIMGEYDSAISMEPEGQPYEHLLSFDMPHVETPKEQKIVFNKDTFWFERDYDCKIARHLTQIARPLTKQELVQELVDRQIYSKSAEVPPIWWTPG